MTPRGRTSRRSRRLALVLAAAALALAAIVAGASADGGGEVGFPAQSLGIHDAETSIQSLLANPDGSLVALQGSQIRTFLADGAPAPGGTKPSGLHEASLFSAAGGKTFVAGYRKLTRLDPDGSPDPSFGGTGTVKTGREIKAVLELGSGRIALFGTETNGTHEITSDLTVELRNQDGSAVKGSETTRSIPAEYEGGIPEVVATGDGGALVVGSDFLVELDAEGSFKAGFGEKGEIEDLRGTVGAHVFADGTIETVGAPSGGESVAAGSLVLRRYSSTGQPDAGYGTEGARSFDLGSVFEAKVASWGEDGSVVVGGRVTPRGGCSEGCEEVPALAAFDASGELEKGFGASGVLKLSPLAGDSGERAADGVTALARRPDGSIVAAGNAPPRRTTGFLAAFSPQGALLPGFGEGGIAKALDERPASQELAGFIPQPGGGILGVGTSDVGLEEHPVMVRFGPDGSLDPTFGAGSGYVNLYQPQSYPHGAVGFAAEGDEVLTSVYDYPQEFLLLAHAEDGSPVTSFGSGGSAALPKGDLPKHLAFAPGGEPLVLATHLTDPENSSVLLRYRPDGSLDTSFAHRGVLMLRPPGRHRKLMKGKALMVEPGGKILVGGSQENRFVLLRRLPDGRPDPSFGAGGWSIVKFSHRGRALALARIGSHIYAVGTTGDEGEGQEIALMRFGRDGKLERGFGTDGRVTTRLPTVGYPVQLLPTSHGPLAVLGRGHRPLLRLSRAGGKLALRPVGPTLPFISGAHAVVEGGDLLLGWGLYDRATESVHYRFDRLPLG